MGDKLHESLCSKGRSLDELYENRYALAFGTNRYEIVLRHLEYSNRESVKLPPLGLIRAGDGVIMEKKYNLVNLPNREM